MKKLLTILFVLLPVVASGQVTAIIGDSLGVLNDFCGCVTTEVYIIDTTVAQTRVHTAGSNDSVRNVNLECSTATSEVVHIAIYEYDLVGDTPTVQVVLDSVTAGATWAVQRTTVGYKLTEGKTYSMAFNVTGTSTATRNSNVAGYGSYWQDSGGDLDDPFSSTSKTQSVASHNVWAEIVAGGAAAGATTVGAATVGAATVGSQ